MRFLIIILMTAPLLFPLQSTAQEEDAGQTAPAPCSSAKHRQFDFWIGDWNVTSGGEPAGTNSIKLLHNGCVVQENWQGSGEGGISGSSYNIYDQASDQWHQTWVDASGTLLLLDGGFFNGAMVLSGERPTRDGSGMALHRITFTPNEDGSVRQYWEASRDQGATWTVLFDGLYIRMDED